MPRIVRPLFLLIFILSAISQSGSSTIESTSQKFIDLVNINPQNVFSLNLNPLKSSNTKYLSQNIIVVDMGSTGSRLHAFNIQKPPHQANNSIPFITEIAISKSHNHHLRHKPNQRLAMADYADAPQKVGEHILPLYYDLAKQLKNLDIDIEQTPIYFYATAGMRLKDQDKQRLLHQELIKVIKIAGHDQNAIISTTITGELEGIFDWLSVNYKLQTLQNNELTLAALDMGGASTQVAMEYNPKNNQDSDNKNIIDNPNNLFELKFSQKKYTIFSKSILGYGLSQTKKNITNYNHKLAAQECSIATSSINEHFKNYEHNISKDHPNNNSQNEHPKIQLSRFNYIKCGKLIELYLKDKKEHLIIAKAIKTAVDNEMNFVAASGYYYNFNFFNSKIPEDLIKTIPDKCHFHQHDFNSELVLNEACFDATYLKTLLNQGYNIPANYQNFIIPKHDIDWTIGAALYIVTQ